MTHDEFIAGPYRALSAGAKVSPEWIRSAWNDSPLREDVVYELARSVSKTGGFDLASDHWLRLLPTVLTTEQVVDLYVTIRDESERLEFEWRPAFEDAFVEQRVVLPSSKDEQVLSSSMFEMIETGYANGFVGVLFGIQGLPAHEELLFAGLRRARALDRTVLVSLLEEAISRRRV